MFLTLIRLGGEKLKEDIYEYLKMILLSQPLSNLQKNNLQGILNTSEGRSLFSRKIFQSKFNDVIIIVLKLT